MPLRLSKHPDGPDLPPGTLEKRFRSYVAMADWADEVHLAFGLYYARPTHVPPSPVNIRLVTHKKTAFHVEGRGNI